MSDVWTSITTAKIYPSIGIARVGNSPTGFFIGPEHVGETSAPEGGYKDAQGRMKRQAARFRVFGYDKDGRLVQEITKQDATISWTVHLANKKAAWKSFDGLDRNTPLRNAAVKDRARLVIDPGLRTIELGQSAKFDTGTFMGQRVPLGDMRTDDAGRLVVLGGFGQSSSPKRKMLEHYANNDGWHDDVSDGPVTAEIRLKGAGKAVIVAVGAWVIVGPPDFAPPVGTTTTLYDVFRQRAVDTFGLKPPDQPSFTNDIYPILARTLALQWVSQAAGRMHNFLSAVIPPNDSEGTRKMVFERLRNPAEPLVGDMPMLFADSYDARKKKNDPPNEPNETVTRLQYAMLKQWSEGTFVRDWSGSPVDPEITPDGLTRAALDTCVGGPFFPGIEAGWRLRDVCACSEPFRLDHVHLDAGDLTKQMALPWQADFHDCQQEEAGSWWPSQRPDAVVPEAAGPDGAQVEWTRGIIKGSDDRKRRKEMVDGWWKLGVVADRGGRFVETERKE